MLYNKSIQTLDEISAQPFIDAGKKVWGSIKKGAKYIAPKLKDSAGKAGATAQNAIVAGAVAPLGAKIATNTYNNPDKKSKKIKKGYSDSDVAALSVAYKKESYANVFYKNALRIENILEAGKKLSDNQKHFVKPADPAAKVKRKIAKDSQRVAGTLPEVDPAIKAKRQAAALKGAATKAKNKAAREAKIPDYAQGLADKMKGDAEKIASKPKPGHVAPEAIEKAKNLSQAEKVAKTKNFTANVTANNAAIKKAARKLATKYTLGAGAAALGLYGLHKALKKRTNESLSERILNNLTEMKKSTKDKVVTNTARVAGMGAGGVGSYHLARKWNNLVDRGTAEYVNGPLRNQVKAMYDREVDKANRIWAKANNSHPLVRNINQSFAKSEIEFNKKMFKHQLTNMRDEIKATNKVLKANPKVAAILGGAALGGIAAKKTQEYLKNRKNK